MRIASITSGAAGMFCGSCLRDNTLAAALVRQGHDCQLLPTFTPLTLDEPDQSGGRVFLGGVNVYLSEYTAFRWVPRWARGWLDKPGLLRKLERFSGIDDYGRLGELTLSMLRGADGRQRAEFDTLLDYLAREVRPQAVLLTNLLLSAIVPLVRDRLGVPIVVALQGDDIFLNALRSDARGEALRLIRANCAAATGYIATSRYYADFMADYAGLDRDKIRVVYPGLNLKHHPPTPPRPDRPPTIGYFSRIDPHKGLHHLVEAVRKLPDARLRISGWLGSQHRKYLDEQLARLEGRDVEYVACPTLADKLHFMRSIDVLSVPTVYREPKGLYVLEAWAQGVPVVLPAHGSFPELVEESQGGVLFPPGDVSALTGSLEELLGNPERRTTLGAAGERAVRGRFTDDRMAEDTVAALRDWGAA
jgi:glycosyltransferase involved in cell wall biosynthesis